MLEINGFKVVGPTEVVIGKVVEFEGNSTDIFKLVEYYINEYNTYLNRTLATFSIGPHDLPKDSLKEFKESLGRFTRINNVFVEESVMQFLTK